VVSADKEYIMRTILLMGIFPVLVLSQLLAGCGKEADPSKAKYGKSFNVIVAVSGDSYQLDGYSAFENNQSQAFRDGAVLIVGTTDGVTLGGQRFEYREVVLVDKGETGERFRRALPDDVIGLRQPLTILGKSYSRGRFIVPADSRAPEE
jgi:hypothetical protein